MFKLLPRQPMVTGKTLYSVNENGQTYGYDIYENQEPNLIAAYGVDGTFGYVHSEDLGSTPRTPDESIAQQKNRDEFTVIPLYKEDGETVIGKFKLLNNSLK